MTTGADHGGAVRGNGRCAVVVGGSLAGLLAAQALSAYADKVTVVERDRYPGGPVARTGVPQSRHIHVLLSAGQRALDALLPGVVGEILGGGGELIGMPRDLVQLQSGTWYRRFPPSTHIVSASRPLTEWHVRQRILANPRIEVLQAHEATGLLGDATRVRGVRTRERGAGGGERALAADLVVDAAGRGSRAPDWLTAAGAQAPHEETIEAGLAYSSRVYRDPGDIGMDSRGLFVVPHPGQPYGAVVLPIEHRRWLVTLSGFRGEAPPTDEEGFTAFATRFPHPLVHDWLTKATPDSPVFGFRGTANVRRRYDLPGRRPAGFLAVGDALCTFNPVYGQGMTVAALSALALREALAGAGGVPSTRRVQRALCAAVRPAWDISAGSDKNMPGATGNALGTRAVDRPAGWYLRRVQARAGGSRVVGGAFREVLSLNASPASLFAPRVAREVLFRGVRGTPAEPPMRPER